MENSNILLKLNVDVRLMFVMAYLEFPLALEILEKWEGNFHFGKSREILKSQGKFTQKYWKIPVEFLTNILYFFSDI